MCNNLLKRAFFHVGLVYSFLQVWWHFGAYELLNDDVGNNSECVFCQFLKFIKKIYLLVSCWVENKFPKFLFCRRHRLGFYIFPLKNCQKFYQILSGRAINVFKCLQCISPHERKEVVDFVLFRQLIINFEARFEKIFRKLKLLRLPLERGHRFGERLWQFGNSVNIVTEICRILVVCQLLKGPQNFVCFDRRRGVSTVELRLTGRAVLWLLSWRCTWGAVSDLFLHS